jgi:hypothetical protein
MAKPAEKIFWSEDEKLAIVMRAIELRMQKMWDSPLHVLRASIAALPGPLHQALDALVICVPNGLAPRNLECSGRKQSRSLWGSGRVVR